MGDLEQQIRDVHRQLYEVKQAQLDVQQRQNETTLSSLEYRLTYRIGQHERASEKARDRIERVIHERIKFVCLVLGALVSILGLIGLYTVTSYVKGRADSFLEKQRAQVELMTSGFQTTLDGMLDLAKKELTKFQKTTLTYQRLVTQLNSPEFVQVAEPDKSKTIARTQEFVAVLKKYDAVLKKYKVEADYSSMDWTIKGLSEARKREYRTAIGYFDKALELDQGNSMTYRGRGYTYQRLAEFRNAISDYEKAIKIDANNASAKNALAWLLATAPDASIRNGQRAVDMAIQANKLTDHNRASYLDTLAAAYAEMGDFEKAIENQKRAIDLSKNEKQKERFGSRLNLYDTRESYRMTCDPNCP